MTSKWPSDEWVKKPRWKVSHFLRADDQRPRHLGNEIGRTGCGKSVTVDEDLEYEPTGIDTCDRCGHCERRLPKVPPYTGAPTGRTQLKRTRR